MQAPGRRSRTLMPHAHRSASALGRRLSSRYIGLQQTMQISRFDSIGGEIFDFLADCTHNLFPAFCTHIQVPSSAAVGMLGTRDVASAGKPVKQNKFGRDGPLPCLPLKTKLVCHSLQSYLSLSVLAMPLQPCFASVLRWVCFSRLILAMTAIALSRLVAHIVI